MISDLTILKLQFAASVLMGYDYFVSSSIKGILDEWVKKHALKLKERSSEVIAAQLEKMRRNLRIYAITFFVLSIGIICLRLVAVFESDMRTIWLAIVLGLLSVILIIGSFKTVLDRLVVEGLAPMVIPLGVRLISAYLLFTSKGVVAGVGMILLLVSFWARYANAVGA